MIRTPINDGLLQSDLDCAGFDLLNFSGGTGLPVGGTAGQLLQKQSSTDGDAAWTTVSGGSNPLITVNVQDAPYNATGDGVTDDTAAIQSAIDAVHAAGGGTVFFPRGTYLCNGAFDATTNSILKIPWVGVGDPRISIPIALVGEVEATGGNCPKIKSTKTGTGVYPSLLSSGLTAGGNPVNNSTVNFTMVYIRNFFFELYSNPSIGAIQLDTACWASLEDLEITAADADTEPTYGTTAAGILMPAAGNGARSVCNRIRVIGFDTAFRVGEHFRAVDLFAYRCKVGIEFLPGNDTSWVNLTTFELTTDIKFTGYHPVQVLLDTEHKTTGGSWYSSGTAIVDPSNYGRGEIKYAITATDIGHTTGPITKSGGDYLTLYDYSTGIYTQAPSGSMASNTFYIGTDARLVTITGGAKLQVRNPGTGLWADADQWTNP